MLRLSSLLNYGISIAAIVTMSSIPMQAREIAQVQMDSTNWSIQFDRAQRYESSGEYREAEAIYRQILSQPRPSSMNDYMYYYIQIQFGKILQTQGKFAEAIEVLQKVIEANPNNTDVSLQARRSRDNILEQQQTAAQKIAKGLQAIETDPTNSWGYRDLAVGLAMQGQLENGLVFLESRLARPLLPDRAIELARAANDSTVSSDLTLSGYQIANPIHQQAIVLYRQLVVRYPNYEPARQELLEVLDLWGAPEEAIAAYREAIQQQPSDWLYWRLARKLESNGQQSEAIQIYEQSIEHQPTEPDAYLALGRLLENTQQFDRALQIYLQAIEAFPTDSPDDRYCHVVRETGYDRLVKFLASQNSLDRILTILEQFHPNPMAEMYQNLALALKYQNYTEQAAAVYRRLGERYPNVKPRRSGSCGVD